MIEIWIDIPGYEGLYRASSKGRIKSLSRFRKTKGNGNCFVKEKILNGTPNDFGYPQVVLYKNGKRKQYHVHALILLTFVGPCPKGKEACHYPDNNPSNNFLENLRWDTHAENNRDKYRSYV